MIGVATEADSRNAVSTHEVSDGEASSSAPICGSAGITRVCDSANETPASRRTARTRLGWASDELIRGTVRGPVPAAIASRRSARKDLRPRASGWMTCRSARSATDHPLHSRGIDVLDDAHAVRPRVPGGPTRRVIADGIHVTPEWLVLREPADAAARSTELPE